MATTKALELAQLADSITVNANGEITNISTLSSLDISGQIDTSTLVASGSISSDGLVSTDNTLITGGSLQIRSGIPFYLWNSDTTNFMHLQNTGTANTAGDARLSFTGQGIGEVAYITNSGNMGIDGSLVVGGDFTVSGNTTFINSDNLAIEDLNIVLANGAANSSVADGAGITIDGANAQITYNSSGDRWKLNKELYIAVPGNNELVLESSAGSSTVQFNTGSGALSSFIRGGQGGTANLRFQTNGNNDRLIIKDNGDIHFIETDTGNVGIAYDANVGPHGTLLIGGLTAIRSGSVAGLNNAKLSLESNNYENATFIENQNNAQGYTIVLGKSRGTDAGDVDIVQAGDMAGQIMFAAADGTDLRSKIAGISAYVSAGSTPAQNSVVGELRFETTNSTQNTTTRMVIDKDGKVGIGKQIPEDKLHVNGSLQFGDMVAPAKATTTIGSGPDYNLLVGINQDNTDTGFDQIWGEWQSTASDSYFAIKRRSAGDTGTPANRFHLRGSDGWIGIGVTNPQARLQVSESTANTALDVYTNDVTGAVTVAKFRSYDNTNGEVDRFKIKANGDVAFTDVTGADNTIWQPSYKSFGVGNQNPALVNLNNGTHFVVGDGNSTTGATIYSSTTGEGRLYFIDAYNTAPTQGGFVYKHSDDSLAIRTNNEEQVVIKSNGTLINNNDQPTVRPSFMVDFINSSEVLDHRLVYHRSGVGTRVNSAGDIEYMRDGVPRFDYDPITLEPKGILIERSSYNDLSGNTNGPSFRASTAAHLWDVSSSKLGFAERAPDGTMSAALVRTSSNGDRVNATGVASVGGYISWSVFLKQPSVNPATVTTLLLYNNTTASQLGNATITWGVTPTINNGGTVTKHKDGWWRFGFVSNAQVGQGQSVTGYVYINGTGSYNQHGLYVWGGQLEPLNTMTDSAMISSFIPNDYEFGERESAGTYQDENGIIRLAAPNQPRYGYRYHADSKKFLPTGLIAETASTNRMPNTYMGLLASGWAQNQNIAIADYQSTAPDGTKTASTFIPNAQTSTHSTYRLVNASTGATCSSIFLKAKGITTGFIYVDTNGGHSGRLWFDLTNGNYEYDDGLFNNSTLEGYGVEDYGNGWYRPWISCRHSTGAYYFHVNTSGSFAGDATHTPNGTDGFYAWGAQIEDQTAPTSFIYTSSGQAVTRAKDNMFVGSQERGQDILYADLNKNGWYNQNNLGTIMVDFEGMAASNPDGRVFGLTRGYGGDERIDYVMSTGAFQPYVATNSVAQVSISNIDITDGVHSVALSFGKDHFRTVVDGGSVVNDMSGDMPDLTPGYLSIGQNSVNSTNWTKARFRKVAYWPVQLSDDEKKAITED